MKQILNSILDLIFPPRCEVCRKSGPEAMCQDCFLEIKFMKPHLGIHSVSTYEGSLKEAIHRFKFKNRKRLADPLGLLVVNYLSHIPSLNMKELDAIVPVPLHDKRLRERGFNQVDLVAHIINKYFGVPILSALERIKNTKAQFDLKREERFNNIKGAFQIKPDCDVFDKRLLLLDDIYTTGATITECSKCLRDAGAKRVEILTLSRAVEQQA